MSVAHLVETPASAAATQGPITECVDIRFK